jgi:RNA polymerase sigma-70 factor (ECF subfamily)
MSAFADSMVPIYPKMLRYALALKRNRADAEDLAQATFLRAMVNVRRYHDGNLVGWLMHMMHNQHVDDARREFRRGAHVELDDDLSIPASQESTIFLREMMAAIGRLDARKRAVLELVSEQAGGEVDHREIGDRLGIPTGTVASRLCRGRAELQQMVNGGNSQ